MYPLLLVVLIPFYHFLRTSCLAWLCWVNPLPMSLGTSFASSRLHRAVAHIFGDWVCSFQMTLIFAFSPAFGHLDGFTIFLLLLIHLFVLVLTMHSSKGVIHFWYLGHWRLRCWYAFQAKKLYVFTFFLYHLREANIFKCTMRNHLLEIVVARAKITTDRKHWHVTEQAFWVWTDFFSTRATLSTFLCTTLSRTIWPIYVCVLRTISVSCNMLWSYRPIISTSTLSACLVQGLALSNCWLHMHAGSCHLLLFRGIRGSSCGSDWGS
jgi:hypothetical protein